MLLFENQTTNGDSLIYPANGTHQGGPVWLAIVGNFDGATIQIQVDQENIGFQNLVGNAQTQADVNQIFLNKGHRLRLNLSGFGANTDVTASLTT